MTDIGKPGVSLSFTLAAAAVVAASSVSFWMARIQNRRKNLLDMLESLLEDQPLVSELCESVRTDPRVMVFVVGVTTHWKHGYHSHQHMHST